MQQIDKMQDGILGEKMHARYKQTRGQASRSMHPHQQEKVGDNLLSSRLVPEHREAGGQEPKHLSFPRQVQNKK